jgi:hypothetical protein
MSRCRFLRQSPAVPQRQDGGTVSEGSKMLNSPRPRRQTRTAPRPFERQAPAPNLCDLIKRDLSVKPKVPKGLAFDIADLILIRSWAAFHDFRMIVRLDHRAEDEE